METLISFKGLRKSISLEFKKEDQWIGRFWKYTYVEYKEKPIEYDLWICIIPCFPIHYWSKLNK